MKILPPRSYYAPFQPVILLFEDCENDSLWVTLTREDVFLKSSSVRRSPVYKTGCGNQHFSLADQKKMDVEFL